MMDLGTFVIKSCIQEIQSQFFATPKKMSLKVDFVHLDLPYFCFFNLITKKKIFK